MLIIAAVGLDFINKIITIRFVIKSAQTSLLFKSMKKYYGILTLAIIHSLAMSISSNYPYGIQIVSGYFLNTF